jgi:protein TonB
MKKNRVFWSMIGLSAALHGLVIISAAGNNARTPPSLSENQFVSTLKIIKTGTAPQKTAPVKPEEKKSVERSIEPPLDPIPVQEKVSVEEIQENEEPQQSDNGIGDNEEFQEDEGDAENNEEVREGEARGSETITDHEYEALLAYIEDFISKNLVYPPMARRRNIHGVVGVHFEISENGDIDSIVVNHSSNSSILDNAAVSLIRKIRPLENITVKKRTALNVNIAYKLTE